MATAKKRSISLTQEMEDAIQRRLATGRYASDGDVIRAALRVLECYDEERARKRALLDDALSRGIADAEAGRVMPLEEAFARIRKEIGLRGEDHDRIARP
jgi:antitoxin ParD1/3/4